MTSKVTQIATCLLVLYAYLGCYGVNEVPGSNPELESRKKEIESIVECQPGNSLSGCSKKLMDASVIGDIKDLPEEGETASLFDHKRSDDKRVYEGTCLIRLAHHGGKISKFEVAIVEKIGDRPTAP